MSAPAPQQQQAGSSSQGVLNDSDVNEWKDRFNDVLLQAGDVVKYKSPPGAQPWHEAFCGCLNPIDLCCITYCLPCVTFGKTHHRLRKDANLAGYEPVNTSCLLILAAGCICCHWIPLSMQRADLRAKYNLQGDCLTDIAAACCCGLCDLVQQEKEAKYQGQHHAAAVKQPYQPQSGMAYPGQEQQGQQIQMEQPRVPLQPQQE